MRIPFVAFIIIPIAELLLLFEVADLIGGGYTLLLIIVTAFIGITVLKKQGFNTLRRAGARMRSGQLPAQEIVEGMLLAFAGALLLTPGFITDSIGFTLLTSPLRVRIARRILRSGSGFFMAGAGFSTSTQKGNPAAPDKNGNTVEGEYARVDDPRLDSRDKDK